MGKIMAFPSVEPQSVPRAGVQLSLDQPVKTRGVFGGLFIESFQLDIGFMPMHISSEIKSYS